MPDNEDPEARPLKGAWRLFELDSRAFIGTELALAELKLLLVLTARDFEVLEAFEELNATHKPKGIKL